MQFNVIQSEPRFYKEDFCSTKKVTQTKTSYNFLQEHSDEIPHNVNPLKATARFTESGIKFKGKYDEKEVFKCLITIPQ